MLSEFSGEVFSTTVLPASSAGVSFAIAAEKGEFHGITAATTPIASRRTMVSYGAAGSEGSTISSQPNSSAALR